MWRARYRGPDGRERSKHFTRKLDADRWLAGVEVAKARGEWIDPAMSRVTVGSWCESWLQTQQQLKATTRVRYEGLYSKHIEPTWGRVPLSAVTNADVAAWVTRMSAGGLAPASVRYAHRVLSLALKAAVRDDRISRNPADGVPLPKAKSKPRVYLTHSQVSALAVECGPYALLVLVLAYTGLRWGEVAALRVRDVDLLRRRLDVNRAMAEVRGRAVIGSPKDHEQRLVPIPRFLVDDLTTHLAGRALDELVFTAPAGGILRNGNWRRNFFDAATRKVGIVGLSPHGLRHTAASLAIQAGATVTVVQTMLGHSSPVVTLRVYAHLFSDDLDVVADRLHAAKIKSDADQVRTNRPVSDLPVTSQEDRHAS
jgi:integrase